MEESKKYEVGLNLKEHKVETHFLVRIGELMYGSEFSSMYIRNNRLCFEVGEESLEFYKNLINKSKKTINEKN